MSKYVSARKTRGERSARLGVVLRRLREDRGLSLRAVAEAARMDLAHLQKIELGQRIPTEEQATRLAAFFDLDQTKTQAQRIAERFRHEFGQSPAAGEAILILAEEAATYRGRATPESGHSRTIS